MTRAFVIVVAAATMTLVGCGSSGFGTGRLVSAVRGSAEQVDGLRFRSRVSSTSEDDRSFAVTTRSAGRAIRSAQEAARLEAIRYCLTRFGGSTITWEVGPDVAPEAVTLNDGGALVLSGRCISR